jgi:hypothetical protein
MRAIALLLVGLVVVSVMAAPVSASATPLEAEKSEKISNGGAQIEAPDVNVTFEVDPLDEQPTKIRVTATVEFANGVSEFDAFLKDRPSHETTVQQTSGISIARPPPGQVIEITWDGETDPATVTYTVERGERFHEGNRLANRIAAFIDGGEYMYIRDPEIFHPRHPRLNVTSHIKINTAKPVVDGNGLYFVGNHTLYVRSNGAAEFRIVVPPSATLQPDPIEIAETLANASAELPRDSVNKTVYVYVSGGPRKDISQMVGGDISIDDKFHIVGRTDAEDSARNTWIHEYIHTKHTEYPVLGERIEWFTEGSADYFAMLFSLHQDRLTYENFLFNLRKGDSGLGQKFMDDTLSMPETYDGSGTAYDKGRRVLAALDAKIRNATDGQKTLLDVHARMTKQNDSELSYEEFKAIVERVSGRSFDAWLDTYTTTSAVPPIPTNPDMYVSSLEGWDSDADGVTDAAEVEAGTHPFGEQNASANRQDEASTETEYSEEVVKNEAEITLSTPGESGPGFRAGITLLAVVLGLFLMRRE